MENNKTFTLTNGVKTSFFDCHRHFLPTDQSTERIEMIFFVSKVEKDIAPPRLFGKKLYNVV